MLLSTSYKNIMENNQFGFNTTTNEVLEGIDLTGKTVLITGGSGGLGEETARALVEHGAKVTIVARNSDKAEESKQRIFKQTGKNVEIGILELDKPESIRTFVQSWYENNEQLDILINNAGIMACPLTRTTNDWEMQFAVNYLGHFLLTNLLIPALKKSGKARVVNLSSSAHFSGKIDFDDIHFKKREYSAFEAYRQSKIAILWFSNELDRRFSSSGIRSFALHPGSIETGLVRHLPEDTLGEILDSLKESSHMKTISQGAATSCFAATSPQLDGKGGLYLADCQVAIEGEDMNTNYSKHAYNHEAETKLWEVSNSLLKTNF